MYSTYKTVSILINLVVFYQSVCESTVPVIHFQSNGSFSDQTYVMRSGKLGQGDTDLKKLTACVRVKILHLRGERTYFLSYGNIDTADALTGYIERNHYDRLAYDQPYK